MTTLIVFLIVLAGTSFLLICSTAGPHSRKRDAAVACPPGTDALVTLRAQAAAMSATAIVGLDDDRRWIGIGAQQSAIVVGPPRSGKTTTAIVPSILAARGPVVSTSTKVDVLHATAAARARLGPVLYYDPSGTTDTPEGCQTVRWSPLTTARSWPGAQMMAAAMIGASDSAPASDNSAFFASHATSLLQALLYAAAIAPTTHTGDLPNPSDDYYEAAQEAAAPRSIQDVNRWVTSGELAAPLAVLQAANAHDDEAANIAFDDLYNFTRMDPRLRGDIFATAKTCLTAYSNPKTLALASEPNIDPPGFVRSSATVYITVPATLQHIYAPLIVGLLSDIRDATYQRHFEAEQEWPPVFWALDEAANIAKFDKLPNLISECGGQGLQVVACFQDLAQARRRWPGDADGFLTLFNVKVAFGRIGDLATLQSLSALCGEWDRPEYSTQETQGSSRSKPHNPLTIFGSSTTSVNLSNSVTYRRVPQLSAPDIAALRRGESLVITQDSWEVTNNQPLFAGPIAELITAANEPGPPLTLQSSLQPSITAQLQEPTADS